MAKTYHKLAQERAWKCARHTCKRPVTGWRMYLSQDDHEGAVFCYNHGKDAIDAGQYA